MDISIYNKCLLPFYMNSIENIKLDLRIALWLVLSTSMYEGVFKSFI